MAHSILLIVGLFLTVVGVACLVAIVVHAFRQSPGSGVMVLCIPFFVFYYAFVHFEHRFKGPIIAGFAGGLGLGICLQLLGGGGAMFGMAVLG